MDRDLRDRVARWWSGGGGAAGAALSVALWPAERIFRAGVRARGLAYEARLLRSARPAIPTISVGNLTVGGAGKTPVAAWIVSRLRQRGRDPAIVLRGYGRDEILVHRELNPGAGVFASPRRADAIERAAATGHDVAVLDDGFQHRAVRRDLDLVLVSADTWHGNRRLLPRGPWREPLSALARADMALVTRKAASREEAGAVASTLEGFAPAVAVCVLAIDRLLAVAPAGAGPRERDWLVGRGVLAVTSIADPASFARQLEGLGAEVELAAFPDHHEFSDREAREIAARADGRPIVVTRKDAVKLRELAPLAELEVRFATQRVEIESGAQTLDEALARFERT